MEIPFLFYAAAAALLWLLIDAWRKRSEPWAIPSAFIYLTITAWYLVDIFIEPDSYAQFMQGSLNFSYGQILAFLCAYRFMVPSISRRMGANAERVVQRSYCPSAERLFGGALTLWVILFGWGVTRMQGDVFGSLFPLDARAGVNMWSRGAAGNAGSTGFIVSSASYFYILVCASFGMLLFFLRSHFAQVCVVAMIFLTWPFFLLSGTRSIFLAVSMPFFLAYLLFGRQAVWMKLGISAAAFLALNSAFLVVISLRGIGFREYLEGEKMEELEEVETRHQGLNMIQELCFVNEYVEIAGPSYGGRYLVEVLNAVPRALWQGKPLIGIDYAVWRGFSGGDSDIGVVATISTGMIGGGVMNFGRYAGPLFVSLLMALWSGLLARWWLQRASLLRCFLFLAGLGFTFNLGRDITLLVLWPIVFGFVLTRAIELSSARMMPPVFPQRTAATPVRHAVQVARQRPSRPNG